MATAIFEGSGKRTVHGVFTADLGPTDGTSLCWTKLYRAFTASLADLNLSADGQGPRAEGRLGFTWRLRLLNIDAEQNSLLAFLQPELFCARVPRTPNCP